MTITAYFQCHCDFIPYKKHEIVYKFIPVHPSVRQSTAVMIVMITLEVPSIQ